MILLYDTMGAMQNATPLHDLMVSVTLVMNNDADIIRTVIQETSTVVMRQYAYYELLVIDNGSMDDSVEIVKSLQKEIPNIRLMVLSRVYDTEVAFAAALDHSVGDYVVLMDIAHDPPALIPELLAKARSGFDVVIAERKERRENTFMEKFFATLFYKFYANISGFYFAPNASYFRVMSRRAVNSITQIKSKSRYLKYFNAFVGYKQAHVPYTRVHRRSATDRKESFLRMSFRAIDAIISNSILPLRFVTLLGVVASFLNLIYIGYVFAVTLVKNEIAEGWISTSIMNASMFFLLFFILTVMSEYIVRILIEAKEQPLYFIADEYNSSVLHAIKDKINVV